MSEERLIFEAAPGEAQQRSMTVYNPGATALLVSCRPDACATGAESEAEAEAAAALPIVLSSPRGGAASPSYFSWAGATQGAVWVLPQSEATLTFCFRAERPGSFLQSWLLHVAADASEESAVARVCLVGRAIAPPSAAGELGVARLEAQLQRQQTYSACMDLLLTCVVGPATAGRGGGAAPVDASAAAREQQWAERAAAFAAANAPLGLRFSRAGYGQLLALGARAKVAEATWGADVALLMEAVAEAAPVMEEAEAEAIMAEAEALVHALGAPPSSALPQTTVTLARCSVSRVLLALVNEWRDQKNTLHLDVPAWTFQTDETAAALAAPPVGPSPAPPPAPTPPPIDAGKSGGKAPKVKAAAVPDGPVAPTIPPTPPGAGVNFRGLTFRWSWECLAWIAQKPGGGPRVVLEKLVDGASTAWPAAPQPPSVPGSTASTPPKKGKAKPKATPEKLSWETKWGLPVLYEHLPTSSTDADGPPPPAPKEPGSPSSSKSGEASPSSKKPAAPADEAQEAAGLDEETPADPAVVIGEAFRALVLGLADEVSSLFCEATP